MLTLFHKPQSSSATIVWLLEEIRACYELIKVTVRRADGGGERDPINPHPHGKVPALIRDGKLLFETSAIALYLTDLFPDAALAPTIGDVKRGEYLSWLAYRPGVMEPAFIQRRLGCAHIFGTMGWAPPTEVEKLLNEHLYKRKCFLGNLFSAADVVSELELSPCSDPSFCTKHPP
jgi:glutathione S-transferase